MGSDLDSRIPCTKDTRDRLKALKQQGQTYESLLQQMIEQFDREEAA